MQRHLVTVCLPFFNAEKTIERCLISLLSQTYSSFDCIILNNCSTDSSASIVKNYTTGDKRFQLLHNSSNRGYSFSYSYLASLVQTPYLCYLASDDYWDADFLNIAVHKMISSDNSRDKVSAVTVPVAWYSANPTHDSLAMAKDVYPIEYANKYIRVFRYLLSAEDNCRFYGLHDAQIFKRVEIPMNFFGADWVIMAMSLFYGKHFSCVVNKPLVYRERDSDLLKHYPRGVGVFKKYCFVFFPLNTFLIVLSRALGCRGSLAVFPAVVVLNIRTVLGLVLNEVRCFIR